jgi:hypothetical protein
MERKLSINIVEFDGENAIEILYNGYNIVQETIYDNELATEILTLIRETRQTDGNATL